MSVINQCSRTPSRRRVFQVSFVYGLGSLGVLAAACAPSAPPAPQPPPAATAPVKPTAPSSGPAPTVPAPTQAPPKPKTLQSVEFRLNWQPTGYHSPYWAAVDRGFFAENGLDVKLLDGQGSSMVLQLIAGGQQPIGFLDSAVMVQGIQKGVDGRVIACMVQRNFYGILSPADAPLTKPQDLIGKRIVGAVGGAGEVQLPILLKKHGIPEDAVTFVATDAPGKAAAMLSRKVDGEVEQVPVTAITFAEQGFPVQGMLYSDFGLERLSDGISVLNKTLKDQPNMVRGFMAAVAKGWRWATEHPAEAIAIGKKIVNPPLSDAIMEKQWKAVQAFTRTDRTKDKPLFWMDKQDWENTQALLKEAGSLTEIRPVETYYTNEFLSQS